MNALVTGAGGFVGQWLIGALLDRGDDVTGFTLGPPAAIGALTPKQKKAVKWVSGDIRNMGDVVDAVAAARPDAAYHLAGVAYLPAAGDDPAATYDVNTMGVVRLLAAIAQHHKRGASKARVLVIGSGEQYGPHADAEYPLKESAAQKPISVYGASKAAQEIVALQASRDYPIEVIGTRSFNHSGAGQDAKFLLPALAARIKSLGKGAAGDFAVGDTTPVRDFLDVRDVVRAYVALMERGQPGEVYNVSSGKGRTVAEIIEIVLRIAKARATPRRDESLVRRVDLPRSVGDNAKLRNATGWEPEHSIEDTVRDVWEAANRV